MRAPAPESVSFHSLSYDTQNVGLPKFTTPGSAHGARGQILLVPEQLRTPRLKSSARCICALPVLKSIETNLLLVFNSSLSSWPVYHKDGHNQMKRMRKIVQMSLHGGIPCNSLSLYDLMHSVHFADCWMTSWMHLA